MADHSITLTTDAAQEAELQALCSEKGVTVEQLVQTNSDQLLNHYISTRISNRWDALTGAQKEAALTAGEAA